MRAARTLRVVEPESVDVPSAERDVKEALVELEAARSAEKHAIDAFDQDASLEEGAARAQRSRERAERRHSAAEGALADAVRAAGESQRAADLAEMRASIATVQAMPARLWPLIGEILALDRQLDAVVDRIADVEIDAVEHFERAAHLGERHEQSHVVQRSVARPTLRFAALLARVAVARDRTTRRSDLQNGWMEAAVEPRSTDLQKPSYDAAVAVVASLEKSKQ